MVWRFVAGLTKFKHYEGHMDSDLFVESRTDSETKISLFTIQCLFEAQSVDHFSSILARPQLQFFKIITVLLWMHMLLVSVLLTSTIKPPGK